MSCGLPLPAVRREPSPSPSRTFVCACVCLFVSGYVMECKAGRLRVYPFTLITSWCLPPPAAISAVGFQRFLAILLPSVSACWFSPSGPRPTESVVRLHPGMSAFLFQHFFLHMIEYNSESGYTGPVESNAEKTVAVWIISCAPSHTVDACYSFRHDAVSTKKRILTSLEIR